MDIQVNCEKCEYVFSVAKESTGKQNRCPRCNNVMYIPTPEEDLDELPLAPEDNEERLREAHLQAERRRLDHELSHADSTGKESSVPPLPRPQGVPPGTGRTTVKGVILAYLAAMRDTNLARAEQAINLLATHRDEAIRVIDRLATDQFPPAEIGNIPPAVYHGFLKNLRGKL